ncbi:MAG: Mth938-like domain-containing protein, partial [Alphaproteobacteria bacterium]|nr:Mth938-like domain-containing protein [Alphaproteobacteria bacterium]
MDLTPVTTAGRQIVERYGSSGFRVSGIIYPGSVLVFPDRTVPWETTDAAAVTPESLAPVIEHGDVQILLLGLGRTMSLVPGPLRTALRAAGIVVEPMDTGAACRTYNVLAAEGRLVA